MLWKRHPGWSLHRFECGRSISGILDKKGISLYALTGRLCLTTKFDREPEVEQKETPCNTENVVKAWQDYFRLLEQRIPIVNVKTNGNLHCVHIANNEFGYKEYELQNIGKTLALCVIYVKPSFEDEISSAAMNYDPFGYTEHPAKNSPKVPDDL